MYHHSEREKKYMSDFLDTIRNKNEKYKRICLSSLCYVGEKSKASGKQDRDYLAKYGIYKNEIMVNDDR